MSQTSISDTLKQTLSCLPFLTAHLPGIAGTIKAVPEHFQVEEIMPYTACGEGEHVFVTLRRKAWNTADVARTLKEAFSLRSTDVGWGGRKDKNAVTTQTFSLHLPLSMRLDAIQQILDSMPFDLLEIRRHRNKIKTGHVAANRFKIIVSQPAADAWIKAQAIADRLRQHGAANYYGEQRFGWQMRNLDRAQQLIQKGRVGRGKTDQFMISALQSALFNVWLKQRIESGLFDVVIEGDVARKTDTGGMFIVDDPAEAAQRFAARRIVTTGPVYGHKMMAAAGRAGELEERILQSLELDRQLFKALKAPGSRRPAQLLLEDLDISPVTEGLLFCFTLPSGAYATTVLREFLRSEDVSKMKQKGLQYPKDPI
jgi:tRNA pseudouridine13 synthase